MMSKQHLVGGVALGAMVLFASGAAFAQTKTTVQQLEQQIQQLQQNSQAQIQALQAQINQMKDQQRQQAEQAEVVRQQAAEAKAAAAKASTGGLGGTYKVGGVTLKVGGFIESAGIFRSANETADVGSNLGTGVPMSGNATHLSEFRESARQSRLSLLATGDPDKVTKLTAYFETDFLGAAPTANSNESNSYNLRLRQAFAEYDRSDWGFSLVGGQGWSLATLETSGLYPRKEAVPLTIDAQYNVGFNWMRVPQIRLIENFAPGWWGAISFENPQALPYAGAGFFCPAAGNVPPFPGTNACGVIVNNPGVGGGLLNQGGAFTLDVMPDIIVKTAAEPGWGHFELYGLLREFRTEDPLLGTHPTAFGGGVGAGAILPVFPKMLDVQVSGLVGEGIGKYGSAQLPDFTINPANGKPAPIPAVHGLLGLIGHPDPAIDLYGYLGIEHENSKAYNVKYAGGTVPFGYGNALYSNAGCVTGNGAAPAAVTTPPQSLAGSGCNLQSSVEGQVGGWWKFYQGEYGMMEFGASYAHVQVTTFSGGTGTRHGSDNIVMTSFRYYPF